MSKIDTFPLAGERVPENALSATNADTLDGNDSTFFLNASNLNAGTVALSRLPNLPASQTTSGTFANARISASSVQQHIGKSYINGLNVDAATVDGFNSSKSNVINTIAVRDGTGDISARLFRSEFTSASASTPFFVIQQAIGTSNNYLRPATQNQVATNLAAESAFTSAFLGINAKAADSNLLDGLDSTAFAKLSAANIFTADNNQFDYGLSSNYSSSGSSWGGSIWGMGPAHNGGISSTTHSILNMYGISWEMSASANANSNAGAGLYVVYNGVVEAALGNSGIYVDGGGAFTGDPSFNTSDPRLKTEFLDFDSGSIIDAIEVGEFYWDAEKCEAAGFTQYDDVKHYGYNALDVYKTMGEYAAPIAPFDQDPKDKTKSKSGEEYRTGRDRELLSLALMEIKKLRKRVAELEAKNGL